MIYVRECFAYFSSRSFMMSCLIFKYLSHFEFILCMVWGCVLTSLVCMWLTNFSNTTCWRHYLFSIVYSCLLCHRLIDHRCRGLFLDSLFCSIDPYVCFVPIPCCFDYCSFVVLSEVWKGYASSFALFPQDQLAILGLFWVHINFSIICSCFVNNVMGILTGIAGNL